MTESAPTGPISFSELSRMPMTRLKSVGAGKRSESFAKFGVENLLDLLTHYPRRWIDQELRLPRRQNTGIRVRSMCGWKAVICCWIVGKGRNGSFRGMDCGC